MVIFIVWTVFIPLEQKADLNHIKKVCENEDFCNVVMTPEHIKIINTKNLIKHHSLFMQILIV